MCNLNLIVVLEFISRDLYLLQVNLIIMLSLGSMKTDLVITEPCYNEVNYDI